MYSRAARLRVTYTTTLTLQKTLDQIFSGGMSSSMIGIVSASLKVFTHEPQLTITLQQTPQALGVVEDVFKNTIVSVCLANWLVFYQYNG